MSISVFDLFKIGIGPSSSHTVGPMRAARRFVEALARDGQLAQTARLRCELFGSLGATGKGHGSDKALLLGLAGHDPETVDVDAVPALLDGIRRSGQLPLSPGDGSVHAVAFDERSDLVFHRRQSLPQHANGMRFTALAADGSLLSQRQYYSVGGGFVVPDAGGAGGADAAAAPLATPPLPHPFHSAAELLTLTRRLDCSIAELMRRNERQGRSDAEIDAGLLRIWRVMQDCVAQGCRSVGHLPGGLRVRRRAHALHRSLSAATTAAASGASPTDPLQALDWVHLFALAVNEENAAGGRVVTAPTNGAAGIVPAVLHYYVRFVPGADEARVIDFLLTAAAIGLLYKENASISGAEVGCQGEVGVACSMAAAGLCAVLGGTPAQVENAAEIGMEHHLGLTCDPVGGLVQIPCIERNAVASVQAISAARMALHGDGTHHVSLDQVIRTMRQTGADMMSKYKETARGGLAVNIVEC
ncbi:L-serine ammonia-lyase [Sphaerotilus microaerophilus]|uniref:L-serine ammonia-lyase n=1 Tax=Sphaerotilus microaerophilus TaxID=2914710 RepID=UPI002873C38A|nr:L-serine ammonia-lyase [Sphaerotilus sp. FB-5]